MINKALVHALTEELSRTKPSNGYASRTDLIRKVVSIVSSTHLVRPYPPSEFKSQSFADIIEGLKDRWEPSDVGMGVPSVEEAIKQVFASHKSEPKTSEPVASSDPIRDLMEAAKRAADSMGGSSIDSDKVREIAQGVLDDWVKSAEPKTVSRTKIVARAGSGDETPVMAELLRYYKAGSENKDKLLVCSPPSFGKSFDINRLGETYDCFFEHNCSSDVDELSTLRGQITPDDKGNFVNVEGVLTQAMRKASEGKTVLFFFDEILRWGDKCESFLSLLSPVGSQYVWRTNLPSSDGSLEVIKAPVKNLHFVAATNLGGMRPIEALWSRFEIYRLEYSEEIAVKIGKAITALAGLSSSEVERVSTKFAKAMTQTRKLLGEMSINFGLDFRRLATACRMSEDPLEHLASKLEDYCANWDSILGDKAEDSVKALESIRKELS